MAVNDHQVFNFLEPGIMDHVPSRPESFGEALVAENKLMHDLAILELVSLDLTVLKDLVDANFVIQHPEHAPQQVVFFFAHQSMLSVAVTPTRIKAVTLRAKFSKTSCSFSLRYPSGRPSTIKAALALDADFGFGVNKMRRVSDMDAHD